MNNKYQEVANSYSISPEFSCEILAKLKIEEINKNPSNSQLEAFEYVCSEVSQGMELEDAVSAAEEFAKKEVTEQDYTKDDLLSEELSQPDTQISSEQQQQLINIPQKDVSMSQDNSNSESAQINNTDNSSNLDSIIQQQAEQAVKKALANLPNLGQKEYEQIKSKFISKFREQFIKQLLGSNFQQDFANYVEADMEDYNKKHLKYIESLPLLNSSVDSTKTSALPPEK